MAISGQQIINIGAENQVSGSDSLYEAFNKSQNNFTRLFNIASPYNTFNTGIGVSTYANSSSGTVTITNTGVTSIVAGTGITISGDTGAVTISASGNGNVGVTSVGIESTTLLVANTPIVSAGNISIEMTAIPPSVDFAAGQYIAPTMTVDQYGRVVGIANGSGVGTVTSIALTAVGNGLQVSGSPITDSGTIEIVNTGVTRINAGEGITLSDTTGEITISSTNMNYGTVTRIDFSSNNLTITGSPVTSTGNITVDIPNNITLAGNVIANYILANTTLATSGNLTVSGNATMGIVTGTTFNGNFIGPLTGTVGATTPYSGNFTAVTATGNVGANNVNVTTAVTSTGLVANSNSGYLKFTNTTGNYTGFFTPSSISDSSYYVPNVTGTIYSVLGIKDDAATKQLGWKTVVTQTISVTLRDGSTTVTCPPDVVQRDYMLEARDGSFIRVAIS